MNCRKELYNPRLLDSPLGLANLVIIAFSLFLAFAFLQKKNNATGSSFLALQV